MSQKSIHSQNSNSSKRLDFQVEGMGCASCIGKIENGLNKLEGVSEISVNIPQKSVSLNLNTNSHTSVSDIVEAFEKLGFDVMIAQGSALPEQSDQDCQCHNHRDTNDHCAEQSSVPSKSTTSCHSSGCCG